MRREKKNHPGNISALHSPLTPKWMNGLIDDHVRPVYFEMSRKARRLEDYFASILRLQEWFLGVKQSRQQRKVPSGYLQHPEYRAAYLLYFAQLNALRFQGMCRHALQRTGTRALLEEILQRKTVRVLDLGSGPGSAIWGWWYFLQERFTEHVPRLSLEIHFADQSAGALQDAAALATCAAPHFKSLSVAKRCFNVREGLPTGNYDLVFLSYALNELPPMTAHRLMAHLLGRCLNQGLLFVLSPAKSLDSKRLIGLREELLAEFEEVRAVAPCLHQGECPLGSHSLKDFCHFQVEYPVNLGNSFLKVRNYLRARERGSKLRTETKFLNYSYLALTNVSEKAHPLGAGQKLIISSPLAEARSGSVHRICLPGKAGIIHTPRPLFRGYLL